MSSDPLDDSIQITKSHAIPTSVPVIPTSTFLLSRFPTRGFNTISLVKEGLSCPFYITSSGWRIQNRMQKCKEKRNHNNKNNNKGRRVSSLVTFGIYLDMILVMSGDLFIWFLHYFFFLCNNLCSFPRAWLWMILFPCFILCSTAQRHLLCCKCRIARIKL